MYTNGVVFWTETVKATILSASLVRTIQRQRDSINCYVVGLMILTAVILQILDVDRLKDEQEMKQKKPQTDYLDLIKTRGNCVGRMTYDNIDPEFFHKIQLRVADNSQSISLIKNN